MRYLVAIVVVAIPDNEWQELQEEAKK